MKCTTRNFSSKPINRIDHPEFETETMKLEKLASLKSFKTSQTKSIHKDASQMMTDDSDLFPNMMMGGPKSISNHRKSPDLVLHSSKKPSSSLFRQLTFSLLMMVILALLQLFSYSLPLVSCIQRNSNINKYFPYGIYNVQPGEPHRSSRFFRNLAANLPALRDTIPSSSYSKTINRASKLLNKFCYILDIPKFV